MKRFKIEEFGLEFKNLLSGPAPIGRMLNYIYTAGTSELFHINGYRSLDFNGNVGSAWATELMIGLGFVTLGPEVNNKTYLLLTNKGRTIFDLIKDNYINFCEGTRTNDIYLVRTQIQNCNKYLLPELHKIFVSSIPFSILREFLAENGYYYKSKENFMDDLFECVKEQYDTDPTPYNRSARTPTAHNRVPSLLQMCELFGMLEIRESSLYFDQQKINVTISDDFEYTPAEIQEAEKEDSVIVKSIEELFEKYGIDGTQVVESIVRNGSLQKMFKHNLMVTQQRKCVMCGISCEELLVGSHIKPASKSNAAEKADLNNGLLLCCNHDKLFDRYLITFNFMDGEISISDSLSIEERELLNLDESYCLPAELLTEERQQFLMEHNLEFASKEENR